MTFRLACGDVMPGCTAQFAAGSRDKLLQQVAAHAATDHGITVVTPEIAETILARVTAS